MSTLVRIIRSLAVVVYCAALAPSVAGARIWTNTEGETIEAEFSSLRDGRTVLLHADDKTIRAPLAKLSDADRQWVKKHKKIARSRDWGTADGPHYKGKFVLIRNGKVRVKQGSKTALIPFTELSQEDGAYVERLHEHLGTELPEEFVAARPSPEAAPPTPFAVDPPEGPSRDWTDITGRKITAAFAGTRGTNVLLWMRDREFAVPIERLSQADQAWIAERNLSQLSSKIGAGLSGAQVLFRAAKNASPPGPNPSERTPEDEFTYDGPPTSLPKRPQEKTSKENFAEELPTDKVKDSSEGVVSSDPPDPPASDLVDMPAQPIEHIDELSYEEIDARLEEVFGDAEVVGIAECLHCEAGFGYPEDFVVGSPCPFCQTAVTELVSMEEFAEELSLSFGGSSTPWYLGRGFRRIFFFVLIGGLGLLAKLFANSAA